MNKQFVSIIPIISLLSCLNLEAMRLRTAQKFLLPTLAHTAQQTFQKTQFFPLPHASFATRSNPDKQDLLKQTTANAFENLTDDDGKNPLHHATHRGNLDLAKCLIATCHMNPAATCNKGKNALHYAMEGDNVDLVNYLTHEKSAMWHTEDQYNMEPLWYANSPELIAIAISRLLDYQELFKDSDKDQIHIEWLIKAACGGYTGLFHKLISHIPTSDLDDRQKRAIIGSSILSGSFTETTKVASALQIKIEDLDKKTQFYLLCEAIRLRSEAMVKSLIDAIPIEDLDEYTQYLLLRAAIHSRSEAMVKDFIRAIPIKTLNESYRRWIFHTAGYSSIDILNIIMPNIDTDELYTTKGKDYYANAGNLYYALSSLIENNRIEAVKKLVQHPKADLFGSDKVKLLKIAIERDSLEMVDILAGSFQLSSLDASESSDLWKLLATHDSVEINNIIDKHFPFSNLDEFNRRRFFEASIKHGSKTFKMLLKKLPARSLFDVEMACVS